jgi:putative ABC transport system permease protein
MTPLRVLLARLIAVVVRGRREQQLGDEIQAHLDHLADDYERQGLARRDAEAAARRDFGAVEVLKDAYRDQRALPIVETLWADGRHALRRLRSEPRFVVLAVVTFGVGIAISNAAFTIVNASCFRGLPIPEPDRVMALTTRDARAETASLSYADFQDLRRVTRAFDGLAAYSGSAVTLSGDDRPPDRLNGTYISAGAFALLGVRPAIGREFEAADDRPGAAPVSILSQAAWQSRYGGDPSVVGRVIRVNGAASTIVGVMPGTFRFPSTTDIWQPLAGLPGVVEQPRDARTLSVFGRLRAGATPADALAELDAAAAALAEAHAGTNAGVRVMAEPINDRFNGRITDTVWLAFLTAGTIILLISCANVANLLLMRGVSRSREIAIRASLGATRARIARQLLLESFVLALLGGALGLLLSIAAIQWLLSTVPSPGLPFWIEYVVDARVLLVLTLACLVSALLFGVVPALQVSRVRAGDVLKEGGRGSIGGRRTRRWTAAFLAVEMALSIVLLASLARNMLTVLTTVREDVPIDTSPLLSASLTLPASTYPTPEAISLFYEQLQARLDAIDAVAAAATTTQGPLGGAEPRALTITGRTPLGGDPPLTVPALFVGPTYFHTLGLPLREGRAFTEADGTPAEPVAIVNERFAARFFPGESAVGRQIELERPGSTPVGPVRLTIVGVSPTIRQGQSLAPPPVVYLPMRSEPRRSSTLLVRAESGDPAALATAIREAVRAIDPDLPVSRVMPLEQALREASWNGRVSALILRALSAIALLMALVGLYAVTAHGAAQRTREIGVRIALGASPAAAAWMVLRRASKHVLLGMAAGVGATYVFGGLFGPPEPWMFGPLLAALTLVAGLACLAPALRAARTNPVTVLRED